MTESASRRGALLALAVLTLVWSYNWVVMKQVLAYSGPFEFAAIRAVLATLVLFLVLLLRRETLRPPPWRAVLLLGLAQTTAFQALVQWALVDGGAGKTALLAYTMPFWLLLLAWPLLRERPDRRRLAFAAVAAAGLLLVLQPWAGLGGLRSALLALISGLAWAVAVVIAKKAFADGSVTPLRLTAWQMGAGAIGLCLLAACVPEREIAWTAGFGWGLAYNAVLASGLAWVLWALIVQRLPATLAGLVSLAVPLGGVLLAWLLLGERPDAAEAAGMLLIGAALFGISRPSRT
ncbi:threonine/homoserine efflux transporter RhtA [Tahibacter aquaticus]|uniref:Threonine/homoserine efflux transporter RhtA n=1 Tax=Tahibacter aquaticus TaxID=520092 RepID=A0A4V3DLT6_9GAMM|nr:DMT family transporter [Tahibacter aquaticus]TDR41194.1 threonine/homoserine efflux transporter RhtA [Tahibacter aquaticus]